MNCSNDSRPQFWAPVGLPGIQAFHAQFHEHRFGCHAHDGYVIAAMESGGEAFDYRGERFTAMPGSLVLIDPEEPHTGQGATDSPWSYRALYIGRSWFSGQAPTFSLPVVEEPELFRRVCRFHTELEQAPDPARTRTELLRILEALSGRYAVETGCGNGRKKSRPGLESVRHYLQMNFRNQVRLKDMSDLAGVGIFQLMRLFKRLTGYTPHEYLLDLRIREAMDLLRRGEQCTRVAMDLGFADQSHFSRQFKRLVGVSPGRFAHGSQFRSSGWRK